MSLCYLNTNNWLQTRHFEDEQWVTHGMFVVEKEGGRKFMRDVSSGRDGSSLLFLIGEGPTHIEQHNMR
jgi:hypothetical protein